MKINNQLKNEYILLLNKYGIKQNVNKDSFETRYEEIIKQASFGRNSNLINNSLLWDSVISEFYKNDSTLNIKNRVQKISDNIIDNPPLHGHYILMNELVTEYGMKLSQDMYFNIFPTNDFNASAFNTEYGSLILLNTGILKLIHNIVYSSFHLVSENYYTNNNKTELEHKITTSTIISICNYLLNNRHESIYSSQLKMDKDTFFDALFMVGGIKNFIVAHEIAHILLNHTTANGYRNVLVEEKELEISLMSHSQEFEADDLAQKLLIFSDTHKKTFPIIGGALGFLLTHLMILNVQSKLMNKPELYFLATESHPSTFERIKRIDNIIQQYDYKNLTDGLANCTILQKQLKLIEKAVITNSIFGGIQIKL